MTPKWSPIKNSWTSPKNLWVKISSSKFQNLSYHVDKEALRAYLNNDPQMTYDLWPQIPKIPTIWKSLYPSRPYNVTIHLGIFEKMHFFYKFVDRQTQRYRFFFPRGRLGDRGVPPVGENLFNPLIWHSSPFLDQSLSPNWHLSPQIFTILLLVHFFIDFD